MRGALGAPRGVVALRLAALAAPLGVVALCLPAPAAPRRGVALRLAALAAPLGVVALCLAALAMPRAASAQAAGVPSAAARPATDAPPVEVSYALAPGVVRASSPDGVHEVQLGCDGVALHRDGARLYVACGARGVVVLSLANPAAPIVEGRRDLGGDVVALFSGGGRVWAQIARIEAQPIDTATDTSAAPTQGGPGLPPVPAAPGDALTPPGYAPLAQSRGVVPGTEPSAAPERPLDLITPERVPNVWRIGAGADLFLPIGTIGIGGLLDAYVSRHFDGPFMLRAQLSPLGFAVTNAESGSVFGAHLLFGLDTQFLELALGVGSSSTETTATAFSLLQSLRIGALDGLHLAVQTSVYVLESRFDFGAVSGVIQVPVRDGWWLLVRGGGGLVGFYFGDVGVRYRVHGDGGAGSLFLQGVLGGAAVANRAKECDPYGGYCYSTSPGSAGPALGFGVEWRL